MQKKTLVAALFCLTVIFMIGMLAIDTGASSQIIEACSNNKIKMFTASLFISSMEPRITYHSGVLIVIACWLILVFILVEMIM
jgi:hypothetical protein